MIVIWSNGALVPVTEYVYCLGPAGVGGGAGAGGAGAGDARALEHGEAGAAGGDEGEFAHGEGAVEQDQGEDDEGFEQSVHQLPVVRFQLSVGWGVVAATDN